MNGLTLYEVAHDYLEALRTMESLLADGTLTQEIVNDTLEGLSGSMEVKAANVVAYMRNLEAESTAIREAVKPMLARIKTLDSKTEWLRDYVKDQMLRTRITEIKTPYYVIRVRDNPAHVVIDNEAGIPIDCWLEVPAHREPDKTEIKKKILAGDIIECAHLEKGTRLEIK